MRLRILLMLVLPACGVLLSAEAPALKPTAFAIRGARVFVEPGTVLPKATVVIRDGVVEAVGPEVNAPADAVVIEASGLTVYPGFVDALSTWGFDGSLRRSEMGPPEPEDFAAGALAATKPDNRKGMTPEFAVHNALKAEEEQADSWRKAGITSHLIAPDGGLFVGQSALVSLSGAAPRDAVVRATVAQHASLRTLPGSGFPHALMGTVAHCRQTFLDAGHYQRLWLDFEKRGAAGKRPPLDPALAALSKLMSPDRMPTVFEADSRDQIHRALDFAAEFHLKPIIYGGREAWQVTERLKKEEVPVILRLRFDEPPQARFGRRASGPFYESNQDAENALPKRAQEDHKRQVKEETANPAKLHQAGILFGFSTNGVGSDKPAEKFRENLRKAIAAGLPADVALKALTRDAARILGADRQLGIVAAGRPVHLVVTDGDFQDAKTLVCHVFADAAHFEYDKPRKRESKKPEEKKPEKGREKDKKPEKSEEKDKKPAKTEEKDKMPSGLETARIITLPPVASVRPLDNADPTAVLVLYVTPAGAVVIPGQNAALTDPDKISASLKKQFADFERAEKGQGAKVSVVIRADQAADYDKVYNLLGVCKEAGFKKLQLRAVARDDEKKKPADPTKLDPNQSEPSKKPAAPGKPEKPAEPKKPETDADPATEIEADRKPKVHTGGNVLVRGATVLTVAHGTLPKGDVLIRNGRIEKVGPNLEVPMGVAVIDAEGLFVMPGIIDTHCHFAISGGVNEATLSVVPEVCVRDVIAGDDVQIYRALAGGVTTARLLHGSANVIGGQDAVIKLKYGEPPNKLLVADAPRGVKFALGENVKRTDGRFPNSRLGVEAVLIRAFTEARAYRKTWDAYNKAKTSGKPAVEPRRDLRLEALADVLSGDLKVHCHCYRADEILMLLRVADQFGFKVKSLQHVLEGYKIAPEIAEHGASCSTFADWWAYKIEAFDAIPFNSALLNEAGVTVCLKSDSNELMRHLYQESAKCMKYGGMSETDALKTITVNGAKQLGLEKRIGAIEPGMDGDLAIFNGHPLNSYSRVEMTLVEGEVYFQRSEKRTPVTFAKAGPTPDGKGFAPIARSPRGSYVITGATVHPVSGPVIPVGTVVVEKGKITQVMPGLAEVSKVSTDGRPGLALSVIHDGNVTVLAVPAAEGTTIVRAEGRHLYPGMIDAATVLGLTEVGSNRETHDFAEGGDFQPDLRASTAINPDSELIPVTRANGVTAVVTRPIGALVAGQSALINLAGWVPREMAIVDPLALNVEFPAAHPMFTGDPTAPMLGRAIARKQREEKVRRLKELFRLALLHDKARKANPDQPANPRLEALIPYATGEKPVFIQAFRKPEILEALKLAEELKLKVVLSGAIDAWKVTGELKKRDVPIILGQVMTMPQEPYDPYDAPFACAARLHEAGVRFCIRSSGGSNTRNLPYEAAMAVSYGLPPEEGLKAVTLYPARILGVESQLGSIEPGKRANLVLADGDVLQASTQVRALFIDGRPLPPTSKHTRLYARYRERLHEVKQGLAPLGTK